MSSIVKENEVMTATPETAARPPVTAALPGDTASRPQPVALEVVVTVNGARTVEGSDKREPFSEPTKTVLVFSNGAVIRLSSAVAPGQLLFLTNEKTKKEVVCQVVKSKNYRSVSGYVELEFTEQVVGFWGMRFPGDRIGSQPAPAPAATVTPAAVTPPVIPAITPKIEAPAPRPEVPAVQKSVAPVAAQTIAPVTPKPAAPVNVVLAKPVWPSSSILDLPRASDVKPVTIAAKPPASVTPPTMQVTSLPRASEVKLPEAPVAAAPPVAKTEAAPAGKNTSSDALKLEAARLQEQLSSLLFTEAPAPKTVQQAASVLWIDHKKAAETAAKIFEIAKTEPGPLPVPIQTAQPVKSAPAAVKSQLDLEEVKIPAWLEPLARNVSAPSSTEELIEREKSKHAAALAGIAKPAVVPTPLAEPFAEEESVSEVAAPTFGNRLAIDENTSDEKPRTGGSNKMILIGAMAAGILVAAGGTWYLRQQPSAPQASVAAATATPAAGIPGNAVQPIVATGSVSAALGSVASPKTAVTAPAANAQPAATLRDVTENSVAGNAVAARNARLEPQPKKPSLGEVHLAAPTVKHGASATENNEAAPAMTVNGGPMTANSDLLLGGGMVAANAKQPASPAAPLPVGGDVKSAKMISSVRPTYPTLAKTQHISGDVKLDALIDANGRVTTVKVVSGPTLLHQSAMDALRQWKYQPAMLDGKAVPMHLTITIQFRLQ